MRFYDGCLSGGLFFVIGTSIFLAYQWFKKEKLICSKPKTVIAFALIFLILPMMDLMFCLDFKISKPVVKNITVTNIEKDYLKEYSYRRGARGFDIFKLTSSTGEEFYVCNEELEKSLYKTINSTEYINDLHGIDNVAIDDEYLNEILNTSEESNYLEQYNAKYKYVETFRGNFIIGLN